MDIREELKEYGCLDAVIYQNPSFDGAIIGVDLVSNAVIYDYNLMIEQLMKNENMTQIEAIQFIDYNTIRATAYFPQPKPIVLNKFIEK